MHYDYKVVPAPKRAKRVKGVRAPEELFALTLTDAINEVARQGWEYVRAEHLPAEASRGWFRSALAGEQTVLVFRRMREGLGPRLAAAREGEPTSERTHQAALPPEPTLAPTLAAEPASTADRVRRREPAVRVEPVPDDDTAMTPLRPSPRLGPAEG